MSFTGQGKTVSELPQITSLQSEDFIPVAKNGTELGKLSAAKLSEDESRIISELALTAYEEDIEDDEGLLIAKPYGMRALKFNLLKTLIAADIQTTIQEAVKEYVLSQISNPPKIASGRVSVPIASSNTPCPYDVGFESGFFTTAPTVVVSAETSVIGTTVLGVSVSDITKQGFRIYATRTNTSNVPVRWIAVGN